MRVLEPEDATPVGWCSWYGLSEHVDERRLGAQLRPAREHGIEVVRRFVHAGFGHLKLDFLFAGALPGARTVPMNGATALRAGLEAVREGAGEGTWISVLDRWRAARRGVERTAEEAG